MKRLQVLLDDAELRSFQRLARRDRLTTAEWVRRSLRQAAAAESRADTGARLRAIREAHAHTFPTGEIEDMLAEIEQGYDGSPDDPG